LRLGIELRPPPLGTHTSRRDVEKRLSRRSEGVNAPPRPPKKRGREGDRINSGDCRRWRNGEVFRHKRHAECVPHGRRGEGVQKVEPRGEDVVRKTIHIDDGRRDSPSPAVSREVWAGISKYFMALMSEEGCSRSK
jgi:hypothetical protein